LQNTRGDEALREKIIALTIKPAQAQDEQSRVDKQGKTEKPDLGPDEFQQSQ
jgi:hypothetical protein